MPFTASPGLSLGVDAFHMRRHMFGRNSRMPSLGFAEASSVVVGRG